MNTINKITIFTLMILSLLLGSLTAYAATQNDYAPQQSNKTVTVTSMLWDGTIVEAEKPVDVASGGMAQLTALSNVTYNGTSYKFSHFEYHTSARNYVASYSNPMDFYVDPPMTIYAIYTDGTHNTEAYATGGTTGFYKDPAVVGGNTFFYGCIATQGTSVEATAINAILSIATKAEATDTKETIEVATNTADSTTRVFESRLKNGAQFIVAEPLNTTLNAIIEASGVNNKAQILTWDIGSEAFNDAVNSASTDNYSINGLTFSRIPSGTITNTTSYTVNGKTYTRGIKLNINAPVKFNVTKGDVIEVYARGNQTDDSHLIVTNATLKSSDNSIGNKNATNLSVKTYVSDATGEFSVAFSDYNGFVYCIKVNPVTSENIEGPTESTSEAQTESTTKETTTETTTKETTSESTTEAPVTSNKYVHFVGENDAQANNTNISNNAKSVFTNAITASNSLSGTSTVDIDGTTYTLAQRTSNSTHSLDIVVPVGVTNAKLYVFANSSGGSSSRTLSLSGISQTATVTGSKGGLAEFTGLSTGTYTLTGSGGNWGYSLLVLVTDGAVVGPTETTSESQTESTTKETTTKETTTESTTKETTSETTTQAPTPSGDAQWHKYWVNDADIPSGETNDTSYFSGTTTGKGDISAGATTLKIDGTDYTFTMRTSSVTPNITFTVPSDYTANFYFVSYSSGSTGRTATLSSTDGGGYSQDGTTATSKQAPNCLAWEGIDSGAYKFTTSGNVNYSFVAVKLIRSVDPTKGKIKATVTNSNGSAVTGATVTATSGSNTVTLTESQGTYSAINVEPGTYTVKATKTINGQTFENTTTVVVTANNEASANINLNYGTGNISVVVKNTFNNLNTVITDAKVTTNIGGEEITLTYNNGAYVANDVFATSYTITAQKESSTATANVTVQPGQTATAEIALSYDPNAFLYVDVQSQLTQPFNTTDTTTVTNFNDLMTALDTYNNSANGGTIYIDAEKIDCSAQVKVTGSNISLVGIEQANHTFPVMDFSTFRASTEGISASDPEALTKGGDGDAGIRIQGNGNMVQNLIVEKAPDNGIQIKPFVDATTKAHSNPDMLGNNNIIENCIARYNNDTGIQVSAPMPLESEKALVMGSNNTFRWCYSYRNCDVYTFGGNADGFAPKLNVRTGNTFDHCYAWDNSDDGWDAFDKSASSNNTESGKTCAADVTADITYKNSATWNNGNRAVFSGDYDKSKGYPVDTNLFTYELLKSQNVGFDGTNFSSVAGNASVSTSSGVVTWSSWYSTAEGQMNGNGFKFGSADTPKATSWSDGTKTYEVKRVLENCLSFDHKSKGFDNNNTSKLNGYFTNTVGFDNKYNYYLPGYVLPTWTNTLSFSGSSKDNGVTTTTPSSAKQSEIRAEVEDKAWRIFEACQNNVIPGGAEFNIYN